MDTFFTVLHGRRIRDHRHKLNLEMFRLDKLSGDSQALKQLSQGHTVSIVEGLRPDHTKAYTPQYNLTWRRMLA